MKRIVTAIENGTVIDHIRPGMSSHVARILDIQGYKDTVILGMYLQSKKMEQKDLIKIKDVFLDKEQLDKIALISPLATINIIKEHKVVEKFKVDIPDTFEGIIKCRNPTCVSRKEDVPSRFTTYEKDPLKVKCNYCERVYKNFELL